MSVAVFRINFNGKTALHDLYFGALRTAGRWHTPRPGSTTAVVYAAGSRALAQLEMRVHCNGVEPADMALLRLDIADGATIRTASRDLHLARDWRTREAYTQALGNAWFDGRSSLGLWVPSFVEPRESNLLLNPGHAQYDTHVAVTVENGAFHFDPRMF